VAIDEPAQEAHLGPDNPGPAAGLVYHTFNRADARRATFAQGGDYSALEL